MNSNSIYYCHRFPPVIISHCVWLYYRFSLSFRDIELMMAEKSIVITYESIRYWCLKFGKEFSRKLRARHTGYGDQWFLQKLRKQGDQPRFIVTDKLKSYIKPCRNIFPITTHISNKGSNNRAENSHQATRLRERKMRKFKSIKQAQQFLSNFSYVYDFFKLDRHLASAKTFRTLLSHRLKIWHEISQIAPVI